MHSANVVYYVLLLLGILAAAAVVGVIGYVIYFYVFRGLLMPVRETRARVVRKRQREWEVDVPRNVFLSGWRSVLYRIMMTAAGRDVTTTVYDSWDYYAVFSIDGKEQEFALPETTYVDIEEGDEGMLTYKGDLFKYFLPLRPTRP
jgi:hypothetical protein